MNKAEFILPFSMRPSNGLRVCKVKFTLKNAKKAAPSGLGRLLGGGKQRRAPILMRHSKFLSHVVFADSMQLHQICGAAQGNWRAQNHNDFIADFGHAVFHHFDISFFNHFVRRL